MSKLIKNIYSIFNTQDTKTIEIYFELLNVWWLFILWSPSTILNIGPFSTKHQYLLTFFIIIAIVSAALVLFTKNKRFRLGILLCYIAFYLITGLNLLLQPTINPLSGVFICQGILAIALTWRIQVRVGRQGDK